MIPVLYNKNEQQFRTYGLGEISDIINPKVTRERNGQYILYFQYPQNAKFSDVFEEDMRIKSDAGVRTKWQTFEISRVIRREGQLIEVFAKHISQSLLKDALNPSVNVSNSNAQQALNTWNSNRIGDEEFDVWSDITTTNSTGWNIREVSNAFEALAGIQGSILDVWGGEYEFDNKTIRLHKEMGRKSPVPLEYGRNITGLEQDRQEDNIYTSIYPFAVFIPEGDEETETVTLPEYYVDGKYLDMHPKRKIQAVDFSGEFMHDDIPTVDRLRTLANQYTETNEIGLPHENLKVEYIDLSKTLDYQEFQTMEEVELNDTLPIFYPNFGITNENAKVAIVNYDPVKEENISIELGVIGQSFRTVTTGGIDSRLNKIEKQQNETASYIVNNKGNRIWYTTPDENMEHKIGDTWFEENGPYERIRVWNGNQWETIIDSEDINKNADAIAAQQQEIEEAQTTADDAVNEINTAIQNAGFTSLDETIGHVDNTANDAQSNAQTAITDASNALSDAQSALEDSKTAKTNAQTAINKSDEAQSLATDLSDQVSDFEVTVDGFNQVVNDYEGQVSGFRNDVSGFSSTVAAYETQLDEYGEEVSQYATEVATLSNTVDGFESTVGNYQTELLGYRDDVTQYENQVSTMENTVDGFNSTVAQYTTEVDEFGNEVDSYAAQVSTLENTVSGFQSSVDKVEQDYQGLSGTVATHTSEISNLDGEIALKANTSTVNSLTGRVSTAESSITTNANDIKLKASQSSVDTLSGTVNDIGAQVDVTAGQISNKVWNTDIQTAVDEIEVGGRNLAFGTETMKESTSGSVRLRYDVNNEALSKNVGNRITFSFEAKFDRNRDFRIYIVQLPSSYSVASTSVQGGTTEWKKFTVTTGIIEGALENTGAQFTLAASDYGAIRNLKVELGTVATDWTPAPEDTEEVINHVESELTQKYDSISATVSSVDGRVTTNKQTLDSISSTVSGHGGRLSTVEQTANGLKTTVASKASQSQVTQLDDLLSSTVEDVEDNTTQISQNASNINLRVEKGDVVSQLNIDAERTLISSSKILLNANTVSISGTAWMDGAVIANASIDGAKIQDATIGSAKIGSLDVSKISGNKSEFVRSTWNGVSGNYVNITADNGISIQGSSTWRRNYINEIGLEFHRGAASSVLSGHIGYFKGDTGEVRPNESAIDRDLDIHHVGLAARVGVDIALGYGSGDYNGASIYQPAITVSGTTGNVVHYTENTFNDYTKINATLDATNNRVVARGYELDYGASISEYVGAGAGMRIISPGFRWFYGYGDDTTAERIRMQSDRTIFYRDIDLNQQRLQNVGRIDLQRGSTITEWSNSQLRINSHGFRLFWGTNDSSSAERLRLQSDRFIFYRNIDMNGYGISNQSDERLKRDIKDTEINSLEAIKSWNIVGYNWKDNEKNSHLGRQLGLIAQDTPDLAMYDAETDTWSINSSKQIMMTSHAVQQLSHKHDTVAQTVDSHTDTIHTLQQELSQANRKIKELEERIAS